MQQKLTNKYLKGGRSAKAIYGIILITGVLIAFQHDATSPLLIALKVFLAGLVIVLAEAYSEVLGEKIKLKKELNSEEKREIIGDTFIISSVSLYPTVIFLLSALGLFSIERAFDLSYVLCIGGLGFFGFIASQSAGDSRHTSYLKATVTAFIGVAVIVAKYIFSH